MVGGSEGDRKSRVVDASKEMGMCIQEITKRMLTCILQQLGQHDQERVNNVEGRNIRHGPSNETPEIRERSDEASTSGT